MISPRQRVTSTRSPARPSSAGSSVIEVIMVTSTVTATPIPMPVTQPIPMISSPRSDTTTVTPAKSTARPAVSIAATVASRGERPAWRPSRYRVTMNSA